MSTYYRDKVKVAYGAEARAFRSRAEINIAYVNLKMEYDKLAAILDRDDLPPEMFINADLSALVVELSETIAKLSKRNANLQRENKELASIIIAKQNKLDYYEHK